MSDRSLYSRSRVNPESFRSALQVFVAAGYGASEPPSKNRDGWLVRVKKKEELWIEWIDNTQLVVTAVEAPSVDLREEVKRLMLEADIKEIPVI